ncbi:MAG: hypothetical protein ACJASC_003453 [Limimaricola cinnabarinus]|jgi:hypothetical protein|uniref:hypothetical protein n=1 Tax=Limimaricola cinnabarinus TaxID=1125964 RepID=UPI0039E500CA
MFFSDTQLRGIRDTKADDIAEMSRNLGERLSSFLEPNSTRNFNFPFMPANGFPHIDAFLLKEGETYDPCFFRRPSTGILVEFYSLDDTPFDAKFRIGSFSIDFRSKNTGGAEVLIGDSQVAPLPRFDLGSISIRTFGNRAFLNLNSHRCIDLGISEHLDAGDIFVKVAKGSLCLVQFQALHGQDIQHVHFSHCEESRRVKVENTSPRWVLLWEKQAQFYYHTSIICMQLQQVHRISPHLTEDPYSLLSRIEEFQKLAFDCLMAWSYWRPSASSSPENGQWERNSWANGYIPGAFGILYSCTLSVPIEQVQKKFHLFGTRWLTHLHIFSAPLFHRFPDHRHWARRSTNHGLVIYFSYLVGASCIRPEGDKWSAHIEKQCLTTLNKSLDDGCYLEGLNYLQFILLELFPYIWTRWQRSGLSWNRFVAGRFPILLRVKRTMLHASRSDGKLFATFGDCDPMDWIRTVVLFISSVGDEIPAFDKLLEADNTSEQEGNEYLLMALCLPQPSYKSEIPDTVETIIFDKSGMATAQRFSREGAGWSLWACGSTLHLTHNVDHDCGSFFYETNGRPWVVENKGRSAFMHNVWLIPGCSLVDKNDVNSCHGTMSKDGHPLPRTNSGTVDSISDLPESWSGFHIKAPSLYKVGNGTAMIESARRSFFFTTKGPRILIVADQVTSSVPESVKAQFLLHGLEHQTDKRTENRVIDNDLRQVVFAKEVSLEIGKRGDTTTVFEPTIPLDNTRSIGLRAFVEGVNENVRISRAPDSNTAWNIDGYSGMHLTLDFSAWNRLPSFGSTF